MSRTKYLNTPFEELKIHARISNDADALYEVGRRYIAGENCPRKDLMMGYSYLKEAALSGHKLALNDLTQAWMSNRYYDRKIIQFREECQKANIHLDEKVILHCNEAIERVRKEEEEKYKATEKRKKEERKVRRTRRKRKRGILIELVTTCPLFTAWACFDFDACWRYSLVILGAFAPLLHVVHEADKPKKYSRKNDPRGFLRTIEEGGEIFLVFIFAFLAICVPLMVFLVNGSFLLIGTNILNLLVFIFAYVQIFYILIRHFFKVE